MANENEVNYPAETTIGDQCLREPPHEDRDEETRIWLSAAKLRHRISQVAYELYLRRGKRPGRDIDDWLAAEAFVLSQLMRAQRSGEYPNEKEPE